MADVAPFANDRNPASLSGTILEAAGCIYRRSHTVSNYDNSTARVFAHAIRPSEMFEPGPEGLDHAFSLRQMPSLNFWPKAELELLRTPTSGLIGLKIEFTSSRNSRSRFRQNRRLGEYKMTTHGPV